MDDRRLRLAERGALGVAVLVRLAVLRSVLGTPWGRHPMVDAWTYWDQAGRIAAGREAFPEGYYQPPAYPVILALLRRLSGWDDPALAYVFQAALGVLSAWLLLRLGRALGGRLGAPWAGAAAALLHSLYAPVLFFEVDVLTPAVTTACLLGALALLLPNPARPVRAAAAGLLAGLAAAVHPTYLLADAVLAAWTAATRRGAAAFLAALALPLLPTAVENAERFGTLTLVSQNAGINLYIANNPSWRDTAFLPPGLPFRRLALDADPAHRDLAERNRYWRRRAVRESLEHPAAALAALATRAYWSLHDTEIPRNEDLRCRLEPGEPTRWMRWLPVRWGWVLPLAVAGAVAAWRRGGAAGRLAGPLWLALQAPMVVFLVATRYRLAAWPVVELLAPLGLAAVLRRDLPRPAWLAVAAAAAIPWLPIDPRTRLDPVRCTYLRANLALEDGDTEAARTGYEAVLAARPGDLGAHYWLAQIAARAGRPEEAAAHLEEVARRFPDHFPTLRQLGALAERRGDLEAAARWYERAYRVPGDRTATGVRLVRVLVRLGRTEEARALVAADPRLARSRRVREILGAPPP